MSCAHVGGPSFWYAGVSWDGVVAEAFEICHYQHVLINVVVLGHMVPPRVRKLRKPTIMSVNISCLL